ncbi:MAG: hypothetical protein ACJAYB_000924 [Psychromonas sp.]|jgi:hypothetical protein
MNVERGYFIFYKMGGMVVGIVVDSCWQGINCTTLNRHIQGIQLAPRFHCDEGTKA